MTAQLQDTNGKKIKVTGFLVTGKMVIVNPVKTWERMGFTREDPISTSLRLAAAYRGAIYVAGRTPITVLHMGGQNYGCVFSGWRTWTFQISSFWVVTLSGTLT